jgi:signal transduction histidine kinase
MKHLRATKPCTDGRGKLRPLPQSVRQVLVLLVFGGTVWAQPSVRALPVLTHADQIRRLSPEQAALGYPVRIRGVVTDDVPAPDFFVQDGTAGIYVEGSSAPKFAHHWGDLVEVEGVTGPGKFAPVALEQKTRVVGKGTLPNARTSRFSELSSGQQDSQWTRVRGIVRSVSIDRTSWPETVLAMNIASGGGSFNVRTPIAHEQDFSSWIDREVLIEGVCGSLFNTQRQLIRVLFYVPDLQFIKVETQAKEMPFSALMRFSPGEGSQHRVRVQGVVAYQQPGQALFLQDQGQGLRVLTQQNGLLAVGDVVDVLGFPAIGESAPLLENAAFHRVSHAPPPQPVKLDLSVPWEQYDGALITTDATLLHWEMQANGLRLLLQQDSGVFEAMLEPREMGASLASLRVNSELRITGICLVRNGGLWSIPQSFRVLLRTPQDITVLKKASWWNPRNALWLLAIMAAVLFLVLTGMIVLGRRVREQMLVIRQKLQHGAVLEERNRIARELHDTLEQELAAITIQLDLAVDRFRQAPQVALRALDAARSMSRHSMIEARRSVWDLRCDLLENGDLPSALDRIVRSLATEGNAEIHVDVRGTPRRLPGPIEMNLLRIGQEAVSNAAKHGQASRIQIELHYGPESVILRVGDDGRGFNPDLASAVGHFGMLDLRERAESLGSQLQIDSAPGQGTQIAIEVRFERRSSSDAEIKTHTYSGRG